RRTTAEILMQTDHVTKWPVENPSPDKDKGAWWEHFMNHEFLPATAKKYGCGLADVRKQWLDYLKANKLEPKALLKADVHPNDHRCFVMGEIVKRYLVSRPELLSVEAKSSVRTFEVGKDVSWKGSTLSLDFEGNRVDLLPAKGEGVGEVRIDGRKPSEFPGC